METKRTKTSNIWDWFYIVVGSAAIIAFVLMMVLEPEGFFLRSILAVVLGVAAVAKGITGLRKNKR